MAKDIWIKISDGINIKIDSHGRMEIHVSAPNMCNPKRLRVRDIDKMIEDLNRAKEIRLSAPERGAI